MVDQVLSPIYEKQFSGHCYGFRPGKSAKQAILKCKEYIEAGYTGAVDIDLVKLGIGKQKAWEYAKTRKSYWH